MLSRPPVPPQTECRRYGPKGRLASIHSLGASRVFARYIISQRDRDNTWIGLQDEEHVSVRGLRLCPSAASAPHPGHPLTPCPGHQLIPLPQRRHPLTPCPGYKLTPVPYPGTH